MTELIPCPFCGEDCAELYEVSQLTCGYLNSYFIKCGICEIETPKFSDMDDAIEAWNRRATDDKR